jgi:hypothetical protein
MRVRCAVSTSAGPHWPSRPGNACVRQLLGEWGAAFRDIDSISYHAMDCPLQPQRSCRLTSL